MDGRAGVRVRATAPGVVQGLPTTSEPSRLQSRRRAGASAASHDCRRTVAQDRLRRSSFIRIRTMIANIAPADALICLTPQFSQIEFSGTAADSEENNNQQFC